MKGFLFVFFCLTSSLSYCNPRDSLTKLSKENFFLRTKLSESDSIIKYENYRLQEKIASLDRCLTSRFDDFLKIGGTIITLLVLVVTASWINAHRTAKKAAEDLFENNFKKYRLRIKKMEADAQEALERIEAHESSVIAMRSHIGEITDEADGHAKEVVAKTLAELLQKMSKNV